MKPIQTPLDERIRERLSEMPEGKRVRIVLIPLFLIFFAIFISTTFLFKSLDLEDSLLHFVSYLYCSGLVIIGAGVLAYIDGSRKALVKWGLAIGVILYVIGVGAGVFLSV